MKINFTLRIEESVKEELKVLAEKDGRTVTGLINKIILDYIKTNK